MPTSSRRQIARWVSILAHPFVLIPLLGAYATGRSLPPGQAVTVVAIVVLAAIGPMLWIISRRVRAGTWADHDVSVREERSRFYPVALAVAAVTLLLMVAVRPPRGVIAGTVAILVLVGISSIVNLFLKVSLHVGFAVFTAVALLPGSPWVGGAAAALAVAVAWSRLELRRHTLAEVLGGALLGGLVGVALVFWPR